jgi:uncharacterized protein (TIGR03067 family)
MWVRLLLLVLSVTLLSFAPAPFQKTERRRIDPNDVTGVWELTVSEMRGVSEGPNEINYLCEITKEQFAFVHKSNRRRTAVYALRLYPDVAPPAFTWSSNNAVAFVGSYRVRGDELTLVFDSGSNVEQRQKDFEGRPTWRYVLRRLHR